MKGLILFSIMLMDILVGMEFDLLVPSFPELQHHFHLTPVWVEALLSVNFAGYCLSLFLTGEAADRFGPKPVILSGLLLFVIGSICCLASASFLLLLGRFLQGVGIAAPAILSFLFVAERYPLKDQQFLLAMLNGSMNIACGIAPVIGSYVALYFQWRANFVLLLLLGLITLLMTTLFVPSFSSARSTALPVRGWGSLFRSGRLMLMITHMIFICVPYWIFVGMSPLLYIKALHVPLSHFGYYQGVLALSFALGCILLAWLMKRYGYHPRRMLSVSLIILIASMGCIGLVLRSVHPLWITLAMLLFVLGQIVPGNILYPVVLQIVPDAKGRVSAFIQAGRLALSSLALEVAGFYYDGSFFVIGLSLIVFVVVGVVTLFFIIRNKALMAVGQ